MREIGGTLLVHLPVQLIQRFGIDTIPTLMLFKDGEVLGSVVAPGSKAAIETFIQETLAQ